MSSSVDGAVDSISKTQRNLAAVLLSPSTSLDSKGTGATGSTEEPGTATRSLIASVHGRSSLRGSILSASFHNATTGKTSTQLGGDSDAQGGDERRSGGGEGAGSGASSTGSWSDFAGSVGGEVREDKDATPTRRVKDEESDKDALSVSPLKEDYAMALSILEQSMPVTDEQEEEGLALSVDRDSDHFNRWLVDMIANARGDGSSSNGGDDEAYRVIEDAASQTRLGHNHPRSSRTTTSTPSEIFTESGSESIDLHGALHSQMARTDSVVDDLEPLVASDILSFKFDDTESVVVKEEQTEEVKPEAVKEEAQASDSEDSEDSKSEASSTATTAPTVSSSSRGWKALSAVLGLGLVASVGHPHLPTLLAMLPLIPTWTESIEKAAFAPENITSAFDLFDDPIALGEPLPTSALLTLAAAVVLGASLLVRSYVTEPARHRLAPLGRLAPIPVEKKSVAAATRESRQLVAEGTRRYQLGQLTPAATAFEAASKLAQTPSDKATSSEWLGRTRHRQARAEHSPRLVHAAISAFERSVRFDGTRATSRASWGRALFLLQDYAAAEKVLLGAIRRDPTLAYAHEYLGKVRVALGRWEEAEHDLRTSIELDPNAYSTLAFLGEQLHTRGGSTRAAREFLDRAVKLRWDYPAAHARLAFVANEVLDSATAAKHWRAVLACRETGCVDDNLPSTLSAIQGATPYLSLYFATDTRDGPGLRIQVLKEGAKVYPDHGLMGLLLAINLRRSRSREERGTGLAKLRRREEDLQRRVERDVEDVDARGLFALVLLGLGKTKKAEAEYAAFWKRVGGRTSAQVEGMGSDLSFTAMAFYELEPRRAGGCAAAAR